MIDYLINPGQRRLLLCFMSVTIFIAAASGFMSEYFTRQFLKTQIEEKTAMLGYLSDTGLLQNSEQVEHSTLSGLLDGQYDQRQLESGRNWLAAYGYEQPDTWSYYSAHDRLSLTGFLFSFIPAVFGILIIAFISYLIIASLYRNMRAIADKAQQIAADPGRTILFGSQEENGEGDLAVLRHAVMHLAEKASGQLKTLERDKDYLQNFLSDISHQIKTPLASLQLYFDLMLQNRQMPEEKRQQFIEQGQVQIRRIDWLIQGLLKMARIDAGSVKMRLVPADFAETAAQAISPFAEQISQRRISLINTIPSGTIWPHDPEWLAEALSNLIKNAIEHTPEGGTIELSATRTSLSLQLQISDNGPGIPANEFNRIFERFYRQESSSRPDSVGIGLSLARSIFEQNGADLIAGIRPGGGAVFTATFLKKA